MHRCSAIKSTGNVCGRSSDRLYNGMGYSQKLSMKQRDRLNQDIGSPGLALFSLLFCLVQEPLNEISAPWSAWRAIDALRVARRVRLNCVCSTLRGAGAMRLAQFFGSLKEDGRVLLTSTFCADKPTIRATFANRSTREEDIAVLLYAEARVGSFSIV